MYILRQSWVSLIVQKFKLLILVLCRQSFHLFSLQLRALVPRSVAGVPTYWSCKYKHEKQYNYDDCLAREVFSDSQSGTL